MARTEGIGVTFDGISTSYLDHARGRGVRGVRGHRRLGREREVDLIVEEAARCGCECGVCREGRRGGEGRQGIRYY